MRQARIKVMEETAVYHCISRVVGGQFLLNDPAKETFRPFMWQQADFAGLQILTYCLMSNHTHILVRVPRPGEVSDAELADRVQALYGADAPETLRLRQDLARGIAIPRQVRRRLLRRMGDVSAFMKELKQRFSRWYNEVHDRFGTLWAERFKSVLVEDNSEALRLRIRYFGDGLVLGSEAYVNGIFRQFRGHFGPKRQSGARRLRQLPLEELRTLRDLKKNVVS